MVVMFGVEESDDTDTRGAMVIKVVLGVEVVEDGFVGLCKGCFVS